MEKITSKDNPKVKRARSLERRRERYRLGEFLVEGVRLVEEALRKSAPLTGLFIIPELLDESRGRELLSAAESTDVPVYEVTEAVLDSIALTETPQGVVAVSRFVELPVEPAGISLYLVVDGVRDPGNLGAILRTAQAAGVDAVFLMKGTADVWSPKTVRSAMGAHFILPVQQLASLDDLPSVESIYVAEARDGMPYDEVDWNKATALVVGGEAFGPEREARTRATSSVSIPMLGEADSLNVAVAAGIILFEASRRRRVVR